MFLEDLDEEDYEIAIKVVIVGNGAVGKSSMIQRYCKGIFTRNYKKTIGVDFLEKHITASGEDVRLMLWDTAGQEEFDAITKAYYRGAQACVIAFSTTDKASFDAVKKWKRKVEDECGHIPMVLVQNKIDLLHESQVDNYEIEKFARNTGLKLFRTSVKENLNVSKVFHTLAERHIEAVSRWSDESEDAMFAIGHAHNGLNNAHVTSNGTGHNMRVRFSSSTENIEAGSNNSSTSSSSGGGGGNNFYYHTRLLPLQHAQYINHGPGSGFFPGNPGNERKTRKNKRLFFMQQQQQPSENRTIVLANPFRKNRKSQISGGGGSPPMFHPHPHHHSAGFSAPFSVSPIHSSGNSRPSNKPSCRVI